MGKFINRKGVKYGRLTALSREPHKRYVMWNCLCDCGNTKVIRGDSLSSGLTKSCGCLMVETSTKKATTHGLKGTKLYSLWKTMKARCYQPKNQNYKWYGGSGVTVCSEWLNDPVAFVKWCKENGWKPGLELDKDILGNGLIYSPETCCFVTHKENCQNRRKRGSVK